MYDYDDDSSSFLNLTNNTLNITIDGRTGTLFFSLTFFTVTLLSTIYLLVRHLGNWTDSIAQSAICRIVIMHPLYSLSCFLSILFYKQAIYFELVRDCYESFVLYQFLNLLIYYFDCACRTLDLKGGGGGGGGGNQVSFTTNDYEYGLPVFAEEEDEEEMVVMNKKRVEDNHTFTINSTADVSLDDDPLTEDIIYIKKSRKETAIDILRETGAFLEKYTTARSHPIPCCCLPLVQPGNGFLIQTKRAVMQYIIIRPLSTLIAIIMHAFNLYHHGSFNPYYGYVWLTLTINFSAVISLYWLVIFFQVIYSTITVYKPLFKFLSIKMAVFLIFWQSIPITLIYYFSLLPTISYLDNQETANVLNNFVISFEIMILALFNLRVFTYEVYKKDDRHNDEKLTKVIRRGVRALGKDVLNPDDVIMDTGTTFKHNIVSHMTKND
jgi:hypothetical protein